MSGFLKNIKGDGDSSFNANSWMHRDIGNAKQYDTSSYDIIETFTPPDLDEPFTFFNIRQNTPGGVLISNYASSSGGIINSYFYLALGGAGQIYLRMATQNKQNELICNSVPFASLTKRNSFTIVKGSGFSNDNIKMYVNGIQTEVVVTTFVNNSPSNYIHTSTIPYFINKYANNSTIFMYEQKIAKLSAVNYAQSDDEIARDAALGYQTASNGLFLLDVDFDKTTGDNLTDNSPNNYTITSYGNKNFASFY